MAPEIRRQRNMFTDEWDDTRSRRQKRLDRERELPKPVEMFSQRELAQFGVNAHPLLPLSPNTKLLLIAEDPRSEEEIAQDTQRSAEENTVLMFGATGDT